MPTPQQAAAVPLWVRGLRANLLGSVGRSWGVIEQRGKAKVFVRFSDGTRRSVVLPYAWVPAQARSILQAVEVLSQALHAGRTLEEAMVAIRGSSAPPPPVAHAVEDDLLAVWQAFGQFKVGSGAIKPTTWAKDYAPSAARLVEVHSSATTAKELLTAIGEQWPAGARRRQIVVQHITAMLRWACDEGKLPADRWTPPTSLRRYVGEKVEEKGGALPLSDAQILDLFDALPTDPAGLRWRYALQLIATYGLRPVEVLHLELQTDHALWCNYRKRSGGGTTKPRRLSPLHPEWQDDWHLLDRISADEAMPPFGGGVADAARRYLHRQPAWVPLAAAGATIYSFRHAFALRAHQQYALSPRVTAAVMGHSPETHLRHYGRWTDQATVDTAIAAGIRYRQLTAV
jgi:integrase